MPALVLQCHEQALVVLCCNKLLEWVRSERDRENVVPFLRKVGDLPNGGKQNFQACMDLIEQRGLILGCI